MCNDWMRRGCAVVVLAAATGASGATIYDGFDYPTGALNAQTGTGDGFNAGANWGGSSSAGYTVAASGLTFGSLATSGRAVTVSTVTGQTVGRQLGTTLTGDVFASFLFNFTARPAGAVDNFTEVRLHTSQGGSGTTAGVHFRMEPDQHNSAATPRPAISYEGVNSTAPAVGTSTPALSTTYIYLAKFTNVGSAVAVGNTASAAMWILTQAQFENFRGDGLTEAELNAANVGSGAGDVFDRVSDITIETAGTFSVNSSNFLQMATLGTTGNTTTITYDELRMGTSLDDVTPVPEPGMALLGVCIAGMLWRRRRRS